VTLETLAWMNAIFIGALALYGWWNLTSPLVDRFVEWARWRIAMKLTKGDRAKAEELMRAADALEKKEP